MPHTGVPLPRKAATGTPTTRKTLHLAGLRGTYNATCGQACSGVRKIQT